RPTARTVLGPLFARVSWDLVARTPQREAELANETFIKVQWGTYGNAADALGQMATRAAAPDPRLARFIRESQDLAVAYSRRDAELLRTLGEPAERRNNSLIGDLRRELAVTAGKMAELIDRISRDFPNYAALIGPQIMTTREVQALLREDEALLFFLAEPEG